MAPLSCNSHNQPQFRLKRQQLRLATVIGVGKKNLMSDYTDIYPKLDREAARRIFPCGLLNSELTNRAMDLAVLPTCGKAL